jgi:hypothetical protein
MAYKRATKVRYFSSNHDNNYLKRGNCEEKDCIDITGSQIRRLLTILDSLKDIIHLMLRNPTTGNINTLSNLMSRLITLLNELKPNSSAVTYLITTAQSLLSSLTTTLLPPMRLVSLLQKPVNRLILLITLLCLNLETYILLLKNSNQLEAILAQYTSIGITGATGATGPTGDPGVTGATGITGATGFSLQFVYFR